MTSTTRRLGAALAAGIATLAFAPVALAAPEPCESKFLVSDAAGDQAYKQQGQTVFAGPVNADVVGYFYRVDGGKVTVNIVIEDLNKTLPQGFAAIRYRAYATVGGTVRYVEAKLTSGGVAYTYGSQLEAVYTEEGDTAGNFFEGKKGVVQIELPADGGGKLGTKLEATSASIGLLTNASVPAEAQLPPVYFGVDTAPDGAADGPNTTPTECTTVVADPTPTGDPVTTPQAQQPAPAASSQQPAAQPAAKPLTLSLAKASLSAKKARKSGTLVLKSSEALTAVKATLKRGAVAVGTATVAKVTSSGALKFKFKKPLKKGAHTLVVTGKRANGSAFNVALKVSVTK